MMRVGEPARRGIRVWRASCAGIGTGARTDTPAHTGRAAVWRLEGLVVHGVYNIIGNRLCHSSTAEYIQYGIFSFDPH